MACEITVKHTVAFLFPTGAAQPTIDETASFVKSLVANKADMESAYKISEERSLYVKFKNEAAMQKALLENAAKHSFRYSNGKVVEVIMSVAGGNIRYVRIFDLPPEVSDQHISLVLEKFGKIKRLDREKFPNDLGLGNLSTGVRGVHMDIEREIPPILCFAGRKGRLYYDQMTPRCYLCLAEGHFKATCPKKKLKKKTKENSNSHTYADVAGSSSSSVNADPNEKDETAAATTAIETADNAHSKGPEEISDEEAMEEDLESDETVKVVDRQQIGKAFLTKLMQTIDQTREQQARAEEEQRQQRKKSKPRAETGSVSPPMKKKN